MQHSLQKPIQGIVWKKEHSAIFSCQSGTNQIYHVCVVQEVLNKMLQLLEIKLIYQAKFL